MASKKAKNGLSLAKKHSRFYVIFAVILIILSLIIFFLFVKSSPTFAMTGELSLGDYLKFGKIPAGQVCYGTGGYDDISNTTQVVIADEDNKTLAVSSLSSGSADGNGNCLFNFMFNEIPVNEFYSLEIGSRGKLRYSHSDLEKTDYKLQLSIGDVEYEDTSSTGQETTSTAQLPSREEAEAAIKTNAQDKWDDDYSMVQYEITQQTEAYDWLVDNKDVNNKILSRALEEWDDDYSMVKYEFEMQLEAFNASR